MRRRIHKPSQNSYDKKISEALTLAKKNGLLHDVVMESEAFFLSGAAVEKKQNVIIISASRTFHKNVCDLFEDYSSKSREEGNMKSFLISSSHVTSINAAQAYSLLRIPADVAIVCMGTKLVRYNAAKEMISNAKKKGRALID